MKKTREQIKGRLASRLGISVADLDNATVVLDAIDRNREIERRLYEGNHQ